MLVGVVRIIWWLCVGTKFYNNKTYNLPSKYIQCHSYLNCNSNMLAFDIYRTRVPEPHRSPGCNKWLNLLFADKYKTSRQLDIILKDFLISPNKEKNTKSFWWFSFWEEYFERFYPIYSYIVAPSQPLESWFEYTWNYNTWGM